MRLNLAEYDLLDLVSSAETDGVARMKNVRIATTGSPGTCRCVRINKRVIFNLLDNAIKFSPSSGTVNRVKEPDAVLVSVSDSGPGLPRPVEKGSLTSFPVGARDLGCLRSSGSAWHVQDGSEAHHGRIGSKPHSRKELTSSSLCL
jgi:K+-sensing histidine kinase KdpD